MAEWILAQETRGADKKAALKKEDRIKVRIRTYANNPNLWQVDVQIIHPHTQAPVRKRILAPAGFTSDQAAAWGEERGMEIFLEACKSASEASARVQKKEEKKEPGKRAPKLVTLWVDFQHEYIRTQKASTQAGYRIAWEKDLRPVMGKIAVDKIGTVHLARLRTRMQERGNIQSSVQQVEAKLITCLNWAKERGTLPANHSVPKLRWPKKEGKKHVQVYKEDELELQIEHAQDLEERVLMLLQIDGALRIGECAGLAWRHIDWERGMTIGQNVCHGVLQDSPKGEVGTVPLTSRLKSALLKLRSARPDPEFVFIPIRGKRAHTTDQALAHITKKIQARAGLEVHGPHRNRHSVLTLLAERGESPYALQALARHADIETTMRYYVHVNKLALARQAVGALEARSGKAKEELGKVIQMPARRSFKAY